MGPVYRAYDPESDRLVAVKLFRLDLAPERVHRFVAELEQLIAAAPAHPGLAKPIAVGVREARPFLAQEYVAAESLDVAIRDSGPLSPTDVLRVAIQLAGALDEAAAANITHGALHPRDVLLSTDDTRITGIGIAHALEQIGAAVPVRRPYTAPERIGDASWDRRADVFSLAALVHDMLWGRRIAGTGAQAVESITDLPNGDLQILRTVFARALHEQPLERFQTALEFADALKNAFPDVAATREGRFGSPVVARFRSGRPAADEPLLPLGEPPVVIELEKEVFKQADTPVDLMLRVDHNRFQNIELPAAAEPPAALFAPVTPDASVIPVAPIEPPAPPPTPPGLFEAYQGPSQPAGPESSRSAIWPLALALIVGLALGFAGGYGVGSHDRSAPVVATPPSPPLPAVAVTEPPQLVVAPIKTAAVEQVRLKSDTTTVRAETETPGSRGVRLQPDQKAPVV